MPTTVSTGRPVTVSGIYKCTKCRNEITCVKGNRCPPCISCNHTTFVLVREAK